MKKSTKIISTVLLLCIVLSSIMVLQPFAADVDSAKTGDTAEYTYTYSITVSSKLCAIDYSFSYDKSLVLDKEKSTFGIFNDDNAIINVDIDGMIYVNASSPTDKFDFTQGGLIANLVFTGPSDYQGQAPQPEKLKVYNVERALASGGSLGYSYVQDFCGVVTSGVVPDEDAPTTEPTEEPTTEPTEEPTQEPTEEPTTEPTEEPTSEPTEEPTVAPLDVVPNFRASSTLDRGIRLDWDAYEGGNVYRYIIYIKEGTKWTKVTSTSNLTAFYHDAVFGETYTFNIVAVDEDLKEICDRYEDGITYTYLQYAQFTLAESMDDHIRIEWTEIPGATKYAVYVWQNEEWTKVTTVKTPAYRYTNVEDGKEYKFNVLPLDADSQPVGAMNPDGVTKTYVANNYPVYSRIINTADGVQLYWDKFEGATKYGIYYSDGQGGWVKITSTTNTGITFKGAVDGETYTFRIRAFNKAGKAITGENPPTVTVTYSKSDYVQITGAESTAKGLKLDWEAYSDLVKGEAAAKYAVYIKNGSSWTKAGTVEGTTSYTYTKAQDGQEYTFSVRAFNAAGELISDHTAGYTATYNKP